MYWMPLPRLSSLLFYFLNLSHCSRASGARCLQVTRAPANNAAAGVFCTVQCYFFNCGRVKADEDQAPTRPFSFY